MLQGLPLVLSLSQSVAVASAFQKKAAAQQVAPKIPPKDASSWALRGYSKKTNEMVLQCPGCNSALSPY